MGAPVLNEHISAPVEAFTAYMVPLVEPKYTTPANTAGEVSTTPLESLKVQAAAPPPAG